jgi:acetyl esterase/lipase
MKRNVLLQTVYALSLVALSLTAADEANVKVIENISYKSGDALSEYEKTRCKLDLYIPENAKDLPCILWFHGGGLTEGDKAEKSTAAVARALAADGYIVASANYRLSPMATYPAYIDDSAAALGWLFKNAAAHGGSDKKIFISGHSAGGYLSAMVGLDARWLKPYGLKPDDLAGIIPVAGQMITHSTIRIERGLSKTAVIVDDAAPVHHARKDTPPILLLYAEKDMALRADENIFCFAALKAAGNKRVTLKEIPGRDHSGIGNKIATPGDPAREAIGAFIKEVLKK